MSKTLKKYEMNALNIAVILMLFTASFVRGDEHSIRNLKKAEKICFIPFGSVTDSGRVLFWRRLPRKQEEGILKKLRASKARIIKADILLAEECHVILLDDANKIICGLCIPYATDQPVAVADVYKVTKNFGLFRFGARLSKGKGRIVLDGLGDIINYATKNE